MARPRNTINTHLPENVYIRKRLRKSGKVVIYFTYRVKGKKEISLGTNYNLACIKAAKLNIERIETSENITFTMVAKRFKYEVLPLKKTSTARSYLTLLTPLLHYFENAPLDEIEAQDIARYLKWRKNTAASANNEYNLFNQIWGYAREWGYTNLASPTQGVKKYKINRRHFYVEDEIYNLIHQSAPPLLRDLMDIAYLTGQRPIDLVNIARDQIYQGYLYITQQKTAAKIRFELTGKLAEIINRRLEGDQHYLFRPDKKQQFTPASLAKMFKRVRDKVITEHPELTEQLEQFQFRDLRAKSGTDKAMILGLEEARKQLGHTTAKMTQTYIRQAIPVTPILNSPTDKKGD